MDEIYIYIYISQNPSPLSVLPLAGHIDFCFSPLQLYLLHAKSNAERICNQLFKIIIAMISKLVTLS